MPEGEGGYMRRTKQMTAILLAALMMLSPIGDGVSVVHAAELEAVVQTEDTEQENVKKEGSQPGEDGQDEEEGGQPGEDGQDEEEGGQLEEDGQDEEEKSQPEEDGQDEEEGS